jgi:hypothetical protein
MTHRTGRARPSPVGSEVPRTRRVRDRDVLILAALVVLLVLVANVVTAVVRPLDDLLGFAPTVVVALVAVTVVVIFRSLRSARRPEVDDPEAPTTAAPE